MATIYCYAYSEPKLDLLGIIDDFISFNFIRSYSGIGDWQLVIDGSTLNASRIKGMNIIALENGNAGLVNHIEDVIEEGTHKITYTGIELKGIANKRIVIPPSGEAYEHYRESPEYVIANLINNHIVNPRDSKRRIYSSIAAYEEQDFKITYDGRYGNVLEEIEQIATAYNIGWRASVVDSAIVWEIWQGVNRSANQNINNRMILDYEYGTMKNSSLIVEDGIPTFMVVAGQGEGTERAIHIIDRTETALNRVETFLDARDIEDDSLLPQRGEEKLAEYGDTYNYTVTLSNQAIKQYRIDYDLGDIGTIRDEKVGEPLDYRITSIEEVYENNQLQLNIVFGYDKSLLKDAIKRMNSKRDALLAVEGTPTTNLGNVDGILSIENGGTGASTAAQALTNIGAAALEHTHDYASPTHTHKTTEIDYSMSEITGDSLASALSKGVTIFPIDSTGTDLGFPVTYGIMATFKNSNDRGFSICAGKGSNQQMYFRGLQGSANMSWNKIYTGSDVRYSSSAPTTNLSAGQIWLKPVS